MTYENVDIAELTWFDLERFTKPEVWEKLFDCTSPLQKVAVAHGNVGVL